MPRTIAKRRMIQAARRLYQKEGRIEIDDSARISRAHSNPDGGAYVQAWVWVYDDDTEWEAQNEK